jgi:multicomponent Na+:H+ antiporter subunit G
MLREFLVIGLVMIGAFFMFLAGLGLLRMPDLFLRMSSTTKAGTLGAGLILLGAAIHFDTFDVSTRAFATIGFLLLTAPVAAHMIGRAAYFDGVPLWAGTVQDDLRSHYRASTHTLETDPVPENDSVLVEKFSESESEETEFDR